MIRDLIPKTERLPRPLRRFERELEELWNRFGEPEFGWLTGTEKFAPRINLAETDKAFEVTVDLPGMKPEDFEVELRGNALWITGERKEEKEEKEKNFHRVERHYGEFRRVVELPAPVAENEITAEYTGGVLRVTVPKTTEACTKRVEVKST